MSHGFRRMIILGLLFASPSFVQARVLHVPANYSSIQAAFQDIADSDTIQVARGIYHESLNAPALSFVLQGDAAADTTGIGWATVDPSLLPGSDSLACLTLPFGSHPVIEYLRFRNGPEMYPRRGDGDLAGIVSLSSNPVLRSCVLDSLYGGFSQLNDNAAVTMTADKCQFRQDSMSYFSGVNAVKIVRDCLFQGSGDELLHVTSHSRISRSTFRDNSQDMVHLFGNDIEFDSCVIGPYGSPGHGDTPLLFTGRGRLIGNIFADCWCCMEALLLQPDTINAMEIAYNIFTHNHSSCQTNAGITLHAQEDYFAGSTALIHDNAFIEDTVNGHVKALRLSADAEVRHNRFEDIPSHRQTYTQYAVWCDQGNSVLRDNFFLNTGCAVGTDPEVHPQPYADAIWNYWGDATGPYNSYSNPQGRGDTIIGNVQFVPWYADTAFWNVAEPIRLLPLKYSIAAYPNPFNSKVRIVLELPEAAMVSVEVFDLLGRKVAELYHGPLIDRKEIIWDGSRFASGVYFVQAYETIFHRSLASCKLVLLK